MNYRSLDPEEVEKTIRELHKRISERFEFSGLAKLCEELILISDKAKERAYWMSRPLFGLRFAVAIVACGILGVTFYSVFALKMPDRALQLPDFMQMLDAGSNDLLVLFAVVFSLLTLETRIKRKRALDALHELRSIAHIIDMHQLTKDPQRLIYAGPRTSSSPEANLDAFSLSRYLDYCSEMLSLTGKVAALYAERLNDSVVLSAVNEIETLTTGLARKIWQKLMILERMSHTD